MDLGMHLKDVAPQNGCRAVSAVSLWRGDSAILALANARLELFVFVQIRDELAVSTPPEVSSKRDSTRRGHLDWNGNGTNGQKRVSPVGGRWLQVIYVAIDAC